MVVIDELVIFSQLKDLTATRTSACNTGQVCDVDSSMGAYSMSLASHAELRQPLHLNIQPIALCSGGQ